MPEANVPNRFPPGPSETLTLNLNLNTLNVITGMVEKYGDIVKLSVSGRSNPTYLVIDADYIQRILIGNHANYIKGVGFERVKMLLGNGIIVSGGEFWRRQRTLIQPSFSRGNINQLSAMMKSVTSKMIPLWQQHVDDKKPIDITTQTSEFALEIILRALFSDDLDRIIKSRGSNPFAFLTDDPTRDLAVAMQFRQLTRIVQELIDNRRENSRIPFDLLSLMMDASDKQGRHMSDKELIDEVMTMIIAGHETSAGTLNWAWYELSRNPNIEQCLLDEIQSVLVNDQLAFDDIAKLRYTKQIINETMRLYPPVWLFTRKALGEDRLGGYTVPPGTDIYMLPYLTHRKSEYWDTPHKFSPDHFREDGTNLKHKYAFIPFSAGSRRCIGEYFSYIEMQTHLALLVTKFKLRYVPGEPVELDPGINLRTRNSIMMSVEAR